MARRDGYPGGKWYKRPGQAYARTSKWPTRYYQRKIGGSMIAALAGINTTSDDFEKKEGESPYLWNARLDGTKEQRKRAQSMSRMGQQYYVMPEGAEVTTTANAGGLKIELTEQKSIRWPVYSSVRITQIGLRFSLDDPSETNAHFVLILRDANGNEICRAIKKLTKIYEDGTGIQWFRFIRTVAGNAQLEATIVDDLDNKGKPVGFSLYIDAKGDENHDYSIHELPNLDQSLREEAYEWHRGINIPVTSMKTCSWGTFPVWLQRGYFNAGGDRYSVMGVINAEGNKEIYCVKYARADYHTGEIEIGETTPFEIKKLIPAGKINQKAAHVRMTQAGNELYFVDGYSALQRVNLDDWSISDAVPDAADVDTFGYAGGMYYYANSIIVDGQNFWRCKEDHQGGDHFDAEEQAHWEQESLSSLTAWPGASLIYFLNNRLFLSGFYEATVGVDTPKAEPNLVIMSSITSVKPQYDMYNRSIEFFYVPDMASSQSAAAPVTAFSSIGDYLLIHTTDGIVIETVQSAVEFAGISQSVPEGSQYGVLKQEHVAEGRNVVYFYNPSMGIMRTAGSTATVISGPIDSLMQRLTDEGKAAAHLCVTDDLLRFYVGTDSHNTMSLVNYASVPQHRSYWFRDQNTPVTSTCIDVASNFYMAVHSEYPVMFILDESLKDFDCAILYEYYTKYIGVPNRLDHVIVRRIHVTTLQTYQSSVYIGLDYDHNNKPIVWRKFITPTVKGTFYPEDIFGDDEESGATNLDIRILTTDTRFVQLRLKQYCYDFQAEILQVGFEYANRTTL